MVLAIGPSTAMSCGHAVGPARLGRQARDDPGVGRSPAMPQAWAG